MDTRRAIASCSKSLRNSNMATSTSPGAARMPHARTDQAAPSASPANFSLRHSERNLIVKALEQTRFNKTAAAKVLGMSFRALRYRIKKLGIE